MKKIITIVGARPQFIKAAMLSRAILFNEKYKEEFEEQIIHTGQHYDENMSKIFFSQINAVKPTWQLHCGNASHGEMTGRMLIDIEKILIDNKPDYVVVYGDTNSTLAGALAACKLHIPVVHIEAGLRSFNKKMPEEINRILTDNVSSILCCPTKTAVKNLNDENIYKGVFHVGDIMYDAAIYFGKVAEEKSNIIDTLNLREKQFRLCTIHRAENTDNVERLTGIISALNEISTNETPLVFPVHPRTKLCIKKYPQLDKLLNNKNILTIEPLGFLDMVMLEKKADMILTDSGGIQKEAYFHRTPCITLREETEWVETVDAGWNIIAGYKTDKILESINKVNPQKEIEEYGEGNTANKILELL